MEQTGEFIDAGEAEYVGLANRVLSHGDLMDSRKELAQRVGDGPALAIRATEHTIIKKDWNVSIRLSTSDCRWRPASLATPRCPRFRRVAHSPVQSTHLATT